MDLPGPPARSARATRAPASGLKLIVGILVVFVLLALYGQWEHFQRTRTESVTFIPAPETSPAPSPNED